MPLDARQLDELLSGYLDGQLDAEELRQVEEVLKSDAAAARKLADFRVQSEGLRALAGARHSDLSPEFADRVLAEIQQRQSQTACGPAVPSTIQLTSHDAVRLAEHEKTGGWKYAAALVAAAAVLLVVGLTNNFFTGADPDSQPLVKSDGGTAAEQSSLATANEPENQAEAENTQAWPSTQELANNDRMIAPWSAPAAERSIESSGFPGSRPVFIGNGEFQVAYALVVDIHMSRQALRDGVLEAVFSRSNIETAAPIGIDENLGRAISSSRVIVEQNAPVETASVLYLIRAESMLVDQSLRQIWSDFEHFSEVSFNVAMDNPQTQLINQIARYTDTRFAVNESFAAPVAVSPLIENDLPPTVSVARPQGYVSVEQREQGWAGMGIPSGEREMSTVLLIVHLVD